MLTPPNEKWMRTLLEALCDPARITIVRALRDTTLAASDLAHVIGRNRAATSQHLRVLREVGAIVAEAQGRRRPVHTFRRPAGLDHRRRCVSVRPASAGHGARERVGL